MLLFRSRRGNDLNGELKVEKVSTGGLLALRRLEVQVTPPLVDLRLDRRGTSGLSPGVAIRGGARRDAATSCPYLVDGRYTETHPTRAPLFFSEGDPLFDVGYDTF